MEIWKDIKGHEKYYQISNKGRVRGKDYEITNPIIKGIKKGRIMKVRSHKGYNSILLRNRDEGRQRFHLIHRLIAEHFIPNPENKPQVNHIDGNGLNNEISNLEWVTPSENMKHSYLPHMKRERMNGSKNPSARLSTEQVKTIIKDYYSKRKTQKELAKEYNIAQCTVSAICLRRIRKTA